MLEAWMERLSMLVPNEVRLGMDRLVMREERRDSWWPSLVRERLTLDEVRELLASYAVFRWYNATGQQ